MNPAPRHPPHRPTTSAWTLSLLIHAALIAAFCLFAAPHLPQRPPPLPELPEVTITLALAPSPAHGSPNAGQPNLDHDTNAPLGNSSTPLPLWERVAGYAGRVRGNASNFSSTLVTQAIEQSQSQLQNLNTQLLNLKSQISNLKPAPEPPVIAFTPPPTPPQPDPPANSLAVAAQPQPLAVTNSPDPSTSSANTSGSNATTAGDSAYGSPSGNGLPGPPDGSREGATPGPRGVPWGAGSGLQLLDTITLIYPEESKKRGEQGLVLLRLQILPDGSVGQITVLESPPYPALVDAALTAARRARFHPPTPSDPTLVRLPIRFVLR